MCMRKQGQHINLRSTCKGNTEQVPHGRAPGFAGWDARRAARRVVISSARSTTKQTAFCLGAYGPPCALQKKSPGQGLGESERSQPRGESRPHARGWHV